MRYATLANMLSAFREEEIIQLTDRTGSGAIDTDVVDNALSQAEAEIDPYLAVRYTVPLDPVPPVVTMWACDIARYRLYNAAVTDVVAERYKSAISSLTRVAAGTIKLGAEPPEQTVSFGVNYSAGSSVFGNGGLDGL